METSKKEAQQHVFLDRASRATRGKRMTKLLDEEIEEDERFWNQDALKEENDAEYEEEGEVAHVFDSDFDDDEPEADEEGEKEPNERTRTKKKLIFPGKAPTRDKKKKKNKTKVLSESESAPKDEKTQEGSTPSKHHDLPDDDKGEKIVRKSTRTSVIVKQAEREAIHAALQATMKPIKRKKRRRGEEDDSRRDAFGRSSNRDNELEKFEEGVSKRRKS